MGIHTLNTRDWCHALTSVQNFWRPWNWDGKTKGHTGSCPLTCYGKGESWSYCAVSQGWHGSTSFHWVALWSCHCTGKLQRYYVFKHISRTSIISGLCTRDECCFLNIFTEATNTVNRSFTTGYSKYFHSMKHRSELSHGWGQCIHCHGLSTCPSVK